MNEHALKAKVSSLFFHKNLSKVEIGENLRISRFKVAKLIEDAVKEGIVKIEIQQPQNSHIGLENELEKRFSIFRAVIADSARDYGQLKQNIGRAAADCLSEVVHDGDTVGIAWGTTIYELVQRLPEKIEKENISVVQLTGGLDQVETKYNAIELSSRLAGIFNAKCYQLYAPAIVDCPETKDLLLADSSIRRTLQQFERANIAVVGIGSVIPEPSTLLYHEGFLKEEDLRGTATGGPAGDINTYFYDGNGNPCKLELENRTVGMNLEQLKRVRYVIGVAGGEFKVDAIYAALKGKIINILVTDHHTARQLLDK